MSDQTRRATLAVLGSTAVAGCAGLTGGSQNEDNLPEQCPTSQDLDVEWPRELDTKSAGEFATAYERAYIYKQENGDSDFVSVNIDTRLDRGISRFFRGFSPALSGGFRMTVNSRGSVDSEVMSLTAVRSLPNGRPESDYEDEIDVSGDSLVDNPDYISIEELEDSSIPPVVHFAANTGVGEGEVTDVARIEQYVELIANLPSNSSLKDNKGAYFNVNGTLVILVINIDYSTTGLWRGTAQYYITETVVRRTFEEDGSPKNGQLLECRPPE